MPETVTNRLDVIDSNRRIKVSLTDSGDITAGGEGAEGDLILRSSDNQERVRLSANGRTQVGGGGADGKLSLLSASESTTRGPRGTIVLDGGEGDIFAGGNGASGNLVLRDNQGRDRIHLSGKGEARVGGNGVHGLLRIFKSPDDNADPERAVISLEGQSGHITAGGAGNHGQLSLRNPSGTTRVHVNTGEEVTLELRNDEGIPRVRLSGEKGDLRLGGNGAEGDLLLFPPEGANKTATDATMRMSAGGVAHFGGNGSDADLALYAGGGDNRTGAQATIRMNGGSGEVKIKGSLRYVDGTLRLGSGGLDGTLLLRNAAGVETVRVDGRAGDIILGNADCAEDFDLAEGEECVPGAVMVFAEDGSLRLSACEYDTAVAGVVSGAGSYRPGIVLDRRAGAGAGRRVPLAMLGKVFCLVDADFGAVRPGALLTTSPRRGHAMRASDPARAFGAVIGKALKPLESGRALVPVMVSLQ